MVRMKFTYNFPKIIRSKRKFTNLLNKISKSSEEQSPFLLLQLAPIITGAMIIKIHPLKSSLVLKIFQYSFFKYFCIFKNGYK